MKKYKITLMGLEYKVVSLADGEEYHGISERALLIYPDADVKTDLAVKQGGKEQIERNMAKLLLSIYLSFALKLPKSTLDILLFGNAEKVEIFNTHADLFQTKTQKCKQIFTDIVLMPDKTELKVLTLEFATERARIFECCDLKACDRDLTSRLLVLGGLPDCTYAVIVQASDAALFASSDADIWKRMSALKAYLDFKGLPYTLLYGIQRID